MGRLDGKVAVNAKGVFVGTKFAIPAIGRSGSVSGRGRWAWEHA